MLIKGLREKEGLSFIGLAATIPTLGVGKSGRARCFLPLVVLIVWEREMVDPTGNERRPSVTAVVVEEDGVWG